MYNTDDFLKSIIKDRKPELTEDQVREVCKGVRFWFDVTVDESIDAAVLCLESEV
jgi:hypothetical protein